MTMLRTYDVQLNGTTNSSVAVIILSTEHVDDDKYEYAVVHAL